MRSITGALLVVGGFIGLQSQDRDAGEFGVCVILIGLSYLLFDVVAGLLKWGKAQSEKAQARIDARQAMQQAVDQAKGD